ncbi:ParB/RepB/Spo0J family partition protein [Pseudomaricurvus alkylphenolicus]|jgi:ParB family chromosome partitioning protein|uniref:ParB/RepB/Spo0J family partition protein n=1 Tax=Pseudomaricurvus alkylphenolicus TaxID=1306991 RepID=UPI0014206AA5|nr:ParB/RepB/Spo0J family partition protein [Pseudomaricurvus alkylphenolicus]NIB40739.1 ParB/RepB/Spo0J family partition protein [Pseudomaricurvus alkylphenolicus]
MSVETRDILKAQPLLQTELFANVEVTLQAIDVDKLSPGIYQNREHFDEKALQELAQSLISCGGNISPLNVRPRGKDKFEIIAGERRWRAAQIAGLDKLLCLVGDFSDRQAASITVSENLQREDLNPIEQAQGYQRMSQEFDLTHKEIAESVGKSRVAISNSLRLLSLSLGVRDMLKRGTLSEGHGRTLLGLDPRDQVAVANKARRNEWSVRKLETYIRELNSPKEDLPPSNEDFDIKALEDEVSQQLGHPFRIRLDKRTGKGEFRINFYNAVDFEAALDRIRDTLQLEKL